MATPRRRADPVALIAPVVGSISGGGVFNLPSDMSKAAAPDAIVIGTELYGQVRWTRDMRKREKSPMTTDLITPEELKRITEEKEMAKAREALEKQRKVEGERDHLRDAFMAQQIHPEVFERVSRVVKSAAERGEREVLAIRFSSEYCTDRGRAINNFESGWPDTLTGFARRAFEFWQQELEPRGYKLRAQIMDFPGGMPGDVGIFLRW